MLKIVCPNCSGESSVSFKEDFQGPFSCWKCHSLFNVVVRGGALVSCTSISKDDTAKQREIDALKAKFKDRFRE